MILRLIIKMELNLIYHVIIVVDLQRWVPKNLVFEINEETDINVI